MRVYLSASSIGDFIKCPQKVLYRIKKPFPETPTKEMIIGKIAHSAIEKGWKDRKVAYSILHQEAREEGLTKSDITNLEFYIDIFFMNFSSLLGTKDHIEYNFKLPLHDDVFIVGKMDRISNGNVFDWKTGSRPPTKLSGDVQCIIYEYAYTKLFGKEPTSICIGSLGKGQLIPYTRNQMYVDELFNNIIPRMIRTIKNESYERLGMFNHSCFRCPYKMGCLGKGSEEYVLDDRVVPE